MKPEFIEDQVTQQRWVDPAEKMLDSVANATVKKSGKPIRNFLHGTWLGHPLHTAIVSIPIGALTAGTFLDLLGSLRGTRRYEPGADASVKLGLLTASLAAASGMADWSDSEPPARKVGVLHAMFNGSATLCYVASWLLRKRDDRAAATSTGVAGWLLLLCGAFLGGRLVYNHRMGVDHAQREGPDDFTPVMPETELPEGEMHRVEVDGVAIMVVKQNGRIFALGEKCAHMGGPLSEGKLENGTVQCPWHGSRFALSDGRVLDGPAVFPQPCFQARVRDGQIEVRHALRGEASPVAATSR